MHVISVSGQKYIICQSVLDMYSYQTVKHGVDGCPGSPGADQRQYYSIVIKGSKQLLLVVGAYGYPIQAKRVLSSSCPVDVLLTLRRRPFTPDR